MPTNQNSNPGQADKRENSIVNAVTLLALPWLNFQAKMLDVMREGIQDASNIKPFKTLAMHEFQALMMILDPAGRWRNSLGSEFEKKVEDTYNETVSKMASGSISIIEAQQKLITTLVDQLNKGRVKTSSR